MSLQTLNSTKINQIILDIKIKGESKLKLKPIETYTKMTKPPLDLSIIKMGEIQGFSN